MSCKIQQLAAMQTDRLAKSLNASLTGCADITSPSSPTLPHASSARGTQAPSTEDHVWFEDRWMVASLCDE
jgi:hypothetical protein